MTTTTGTAASTLADRLAEASNLITRLQDTLTDLEGDAFDRGANWAHVGSAGHVTEVLRDLLSGFGK